MHKTLFFAAIVAGLVASPLAMARSPLPPKDLNYHCDFQKWVGQPVAKVKEEVRTLGRPYRIIYEGGIVTQDFIKGRITITQDYKHNVQSVSCE